MSLAHAAAVQIGQQRITIPATPCRFARLPLVGRLNPDREIYPYRQINELEFGRLVEREFLALTLENEFLQLTVLPELGGRLHRALFKPDNYDLFYYNDAIRAQLVSSRGAWYAGGVEFNFPISHSLTTHAGVEWAVSSGGDGSGAITVSNVDRLTRMRWAVTMRLYPGSTAIHFHTRLINRTAWPRRYYYWLNAAVPQGPQIRYHFEASKLIGHVQDIDGVATRLDSFPVLRNGSDARNPAALADTTSVFMLDNHSGFFGYYDLDADLGLVRSAPVRNVPGNKIWSWGDTDYGRRFNRRLVPPGQQFYGELQSGRPESQTDWAIIEPFETIDADEFWYPIPRLGGMTNGGAELSLLAEPDKGRVRLVATRTFAALDVEVSPVGGRGAPLARQRFETVRAGEPVELTLAATREPIRVRVRDGGGRTVFEHVDHASRPDSIIPELYENKASNYSKAPRTAAQLTARAVAAFRANEIPRAESYCEKAIALEPDFAPARRWMGLLWRLAGRPADAAEQFRAAILADPADTASYFHFATLLAERGPADQAILELERVIGYAHGQLRSWAAVLLTQALLRAGRDDEAARVAAEWPAELAFGPLGRLAYRIGQSPHGGSRWWGDPTDLFAQAAESGCVADLLDAWWQRNVKAVDEAADAVLDVAEELCEIGDLARATHVLRWLTNHETLGSACPIAHYRLGELAGDLPAAVARAAAVTDAARMAWPGRLNDDLTLTAAVAAAPEDGLAHALLGLFKLWVGRFDEALSAMEQAVARGRTDATTWRNLGLARWSAGKPWQSCAQAYEQARLQWPDYPPLIAEFDRMLAATGAPLERRAELLEGSLPAALESSDAVTVRRVRLAIDRRDWSGGLALLGRTTFNPGEGRFDTQRLFVQMSIALGEQKASAGQWVEALALFRQALEYPENIGIGRPGRVQEARQHWLIATALDRIGDAEAARAELALLLELCLWKAPTEHYFAILAMRKLGHAAEADRRLAELQAKADNRLADPSDSMRRWGLITAAMAARAGGDRDKSNALLRQAGETEELDAFLASELY